MLKRSLKFSLFALMLFAAAMMFGCGSDGATGPQGPEGPEGPPGPPGTSVSATAETCTICHGEGKIADIADMHPQIDDQTLVSNIVVTNSVAGLPTVDFHVELTDGTAVVGLQDSDIRFMMADLVPEGTDTAQGTWDNPYYERWAYERISTTNPDYVFGTLTDNGGGDYTYEFATAFGSVDTVSVPADDIDPTPTGHPQRLMIRVNGQDDTNRTASFQDFMVPANDGTTPATVLDPQRQYVTAGACKACHGPQFDRAAHAGGYYDTLACVMCHSPLGTYGDEMQADYIYFGPLVKQIHNAVENEAFLDRPIIDGASNIRGSWELVGFPQLVQDCVICHNDSGSTVPTDVDTWATHPTQELCGGCHIDVDTTTGENHPGGIQPNTACTVCHQSAGPVNDPSSFPIPGVHDITPRVAGTNGTGDPGFEPQNIREYDVTLTVSPYPNATHFVPGDVIDVTATLVHHSDSTPVSSATYTSPQDTPGVTNDILAEAYVQFSGPRSNAVPVLATDTFSDPNWDGDIDTLEDEHDMFMGGSDPQITTTSAGFGYQSLPIPDDITPGTYIVRVIFADYGRVGSGDYNIDSTAWQTIQIGQAEEELKVAGDACVNCHGTGTAPFHDERHSVPFDTDQCLACHHDGFDAEGEYAHGSPLANRIHAVHYANTDGDIYVFSHGGNRDWSEISFPRDISPDDSNSGCIACHTSGDDTYQTLPYMQPCSGCHVGDPNNPLEAGGYSHMIQNGGPWLLAPTE